MAKRLSTEDFIIKAKAVHGNKYDYSKTKYITSKNNTCITCRKHGDFFQTPSNHLRGSGCPLCSKKFTTESFIKLSKEKYGNSFDYSNTEYVDLKHKIRVMCNICGSEIIQSPLSHLKSCKCKNCIPSKQSKKDRFIAKANILFNNKYDYSKVNYVSARSKVLIVCPLHGDFMQTPYSHLHGKYGCKKCYYEFIGKSNKFSTESFISKARAVHGDKYDYSKTVYSGSRTKITIICPEHGGVLVNPQHHLEGHRCPKCANNVLLSTEDFISKARAVHGDKYDYSKAEYLNNKAKISIICPTHGKFMQIANSHLSGRGCPECAKAITSKGENKIAEILTRMNIRFIHDKACLPFLGRKRPDFYLPDYNVVIEYDGKQHFSQPHGAWKKYYNNLETVIANDLLKEDLCRQNGVDVIRIPYFEYDNIEQIISDRIKKQ